LLQRSTSCDLKPLSEISKSQVWVLVWCKFKRKWVCRFGAYTWSCQ